MKIVNASNTVLRMDEPAYQIHEYRDKSEDSLFWKRWQMVCIVRDDELVGYVEDLGWEGMTRVRRISYLGGFINPKTGRGDTTYTVAELKDIADHMRAQPDTADQIPRRDWLQEWYDGLEEKQRAIRGLTTSGPISTLQRG